jgi:hypothetical protein
MRLLCSPYNFLRAIIRNPKKDTMNKYGLWLSIPNTNNTARTATAILVLSYDSVH